MPTYHEILPLFPPTTTIKMFGVTKCLHKNQNKTFSTKENSKHFSECCCCYHEQRISLSISLFLSLSLLRSLAYPLTTATTTTSSTFFLYVQSISLRRVLHNTALDIMYYTSPLYRSTVVNGLKNELNKVYRVFSDRNPDFNGKVKT